MAIADKLTKLQSDISDAYDTIETKGGTLPTDKNTNNLSTAIDSIPSGGQPTQDGDFRVRFFDVDGTILKEEWVDKGEDATPPANPSYDSTYLTFVEWNNDYTNIQQDLDIGAWYQTKNGYSIIKYKLNKATTNELNITLKYNVYAVEDATIDWGDGNTETLPKTGYNDGTITHTYEGNVGDEFIIKITKLSYFGSPLFSTNAARGCVYAVYSAANANADNSRNSSMNLKAYVSGKNVYASTLNGNSYALQVFILPKNVLYAGGTLSLVNVKNIIIGKPRNTGNRIPANFQYCYLTEECVNSFYLAPSNTENNLLSYNNIKDINLENITSFTLNTLYWKADSVYFKQLTTLKFSYSNNLYEINNLILNTNSMVTINDTEANIINFYYKYKESMKIYVPDTLLSTYQQDTNWSILSDMLKPISELPTDSYFYRYVK